jgi:hypothetical protein
VLLILLHEEWVVEVGAGSVILGIMVAMALVTGKQAVEGGGVVEVDLVVIHKMVAIDLVVIHKMVAIDLVVIHKMVAIDMVVIHKMVAIDMVVISKMVAIDMVVIHKMVAIDMVVIHKMVAIKMTMGWLVEMSLHEAEVVVGAGEEEGDLERKANGQPE